MEYKLHDCKSYRIHTIKTDKFKNCSMEIMFRKKLEKNEITQNNMLVDMLVHSSNKYPKRRDLAIELENLYSASFRGFTTRLGNSIMLSFVLDFLNPKYCEKGYLDDVLGLPFEMLLNPKLYFSLSKLPLNIEVTSLFPLKTKQKIESSCLIILDKLF